MCMNCFIKVHFIVCKTSHLHAGSSAVKKACAAPPWSSSLQTGWSSSSQGCTLGTSRAPHCHLQAKKGTASSEPPPTIDQDCVATFSNNTCL
ncbi:hypothetical protein ANANG_G00297490, partial [Anguilla anguilla]